MTRPAAGRPGGRAAADRLVAGDSRGPAGHRRGRPSWAASALAGALVLATAAPASAGIGTIPPTATARTATPLAATPLAATPLAATSPAAPIAAAAGLGPAAPALTPWATSAPRTTRDPADDTSDPDQPVTIEIGRLEPRTVTDGSTVTVSGTLSNTGESTLSDVEVRLQRGQVITTRAELLADDADPDPATAVIGPFAAVPGQLAPGQSLPFTYELPADALRLVTEGVYPALVNVNATDDTGLRLRVGELATQLVRRVPATEARTAVAWLWPITADSSRGVAGGFADDELTESISPGGRLDRALAVLERLPRTAGDRGPGTPTTDDPAQAPALPVTMALDPALVEELAVMAAGSYPVDGIEDAGRGTDAAAAFLDRLREVAAVHPVLALPYGDVDADALVEAGLTDVLLRSLAGTTAGTAADPPGAAPRAVPATPTGSPTSAAPQPAQGTSPGATGSAEPGAPTDGGGAEATVPPAGGGTDDDATGQPAEVPAPAEAVGTPAGAGARILADALDVQPRTDLAWAAGGSFAPATVATLQQGGIERLVVGPAGLTGGAQAVGLPGGTATARTTVEVDGESLQVLVADTGLGVLTDTAEQRPGGPRLAEQRYLAELALIGQQAPAGATPTVLVAPPREVEAGPDGVGAMMADTAGLGWLEPRSLESLLGSAPAEAGALIEATGGTGLDPTGMAQILAAERTRDDLAGAVVDDPDEVLQAYDAALARTVSVTAWDDPGEFRAAAADLRAALGRLLERVGLLAPAEGTYSLASRDAPLVLTVRNDLPFAVTVLLDLSTRGTRGIDIADIGAQVLAPGERTTLQVPTEVRQSGGFAVTARLTTPGGTALGEPVRLQVRSTAYGPISLMITFGAAALLALLFLRRLVLFLIRRRRAAGPAGVPETGLSLPPTRSPV